MNHPWPREAWYAQRQGIDRDHIKPNLGSALLTEHVDHVIFNVNMSMGLPEPRSCRNGVILPKLKHCMYYRSRGLEAFLPCA